MKLIIMQGIPGSGKSRYCRLNYPDVVACSADHFMEKLPTFDPSRLKEAHHTCMRAAVGNMIRGDGVVIVDNTNIHPHEAAFYVNSGELLGYDIHIVRVMRPLNIAIAQNVHGVPRHTIERMSESLLRFTDLMPPYWRPYFQVVDNSKEAEE